MSDVHGHKDSKSETFPLDHEQRGHAPTNALYRTADGWLVIACYSDREWDGVRRGLGIADAQWPPYAQARQEGLAASAIARTIEAALAPLTTAAALRRLGAEGVPCTSPSTFEPEELIVEPGLRARGVVVVEQHYDAGEIYEVGHTVRFGSANTINLRPAPVTGQHSVEILRELGRDEAEIDRLISGKVVNAGGRAGSAKTGEQHA